MLQLQMLLKFFLYKWIRVGAHSLEQRVIQEVHGLPMRKVFIHLLCDS
jgi:hypothetical protein